MRIITKDITKMIDSNTEISSKIDWLSVTVGEVKYPPQWSEERAELPHGMLRYDTAVKYIDGRLEMCSSTRKEMKPHIQFSGGCIDRICFDYEIDTVDVLRAMSYGKPSRIDLAIDIKKGSLDIEQLSDHFKQDKALTTARSGLYLSGVKVAGNTLYVGAKGSEKRVRIYDKAAEQGITDFEWTRIELQVRHGSAQSTMPVLVSSNKPHLTIAAIINGFISFPEISEWFLVMGQESFKPTHVSVNTSSRRKWLLETAAKSLATELVLGIEGDYFLEQFLSVVAAEVGRKKAKYKRDKKVKQC